MTAGGTQSRTQATHPSYQKNRRRHSHLTHLFLSTSLKNVAQGKTLCKSNSNLNIFGGSHGMHNLSPILKWSVNVRQVSADD